MGSCISFQNKYTLKGFDYDSDCFNIIKISRVLDLSIYRKFLSVGINTYNFVLQIEYNHYGKRISIYRYFRTHYEAKLEKKSIMKLM